MDHQRRDPLVHGDETSFMKPTVLIIGGGLTGLTAAHRLMKTGTARVTVVERSATVGGLASGFLLNGAPLEKTYHHLFRTDRDILALADELGLGPSLEWRESSMAIFVKGKAHPFGTPKHVLSFSPLSLWSRIRMGAVVFFLQKYKNWKKLEPSSAKLWMRKYSGGPAADVIWDPLLRGKFSGYADKVSMAWLWARIHIRANSRDPSEGKEKLGYFKCGFQTVSERLSERVTAMGGKVHTNAELKGLSRTGTGWEAVVNGKVERYDEVVFTGSTTSFARLLQANHLGEPAYHSALKSIRYLGAACLVFASDQDLGNAYWTNINEEGAPFLVFINHTRFIPAERYGGKHVYYIGAYLETTHPLFVASEAEVVERWFTYLKGLYPEFSNERVSEKHLFRFTDAQHIVDAGYKNRIPEYTTPLPNLWLANFAQIFPEDRGTNYAVREGEKLAGLITKKNTETHV